MVNDAAAGHYSEELDHLLHVGTQDALRKLVQERKLTRHKIAGQFLYCAADRTRKAQQLGARRALLAAPGLVGPIADADLVPNELRAASVLFASLLDERQRRLYAGLESLKCGWGGGHPHRIAARYRRRYRGPRPQATAHRRGRARTRAPPRCAGGPNDGMLRGCKPGRGRGAAGSPTNDRRLDPRKTWCDDDPS